MPLTFGKNMSIRALLIALLLTQLAMGYEVHFTRSGDKIPKKEWTILIEEDSRLEPISEIERTNPTTGEVIKIKMPDSARFQSRKDAPTMFLRFVDGEIRVKILGEADIESLRPIAKALDATIVGEEGEQY